MRASPLVVSLIPLHAQPHTPSDLALLGHLPLKGGGNSLSCYPPAMRLLILLATLLLPACITVDESRVFRAQEVSADRPALSIKHNSDWIASDTYPFLSHALTPMGEHTIATTVVDARVVDYSFEINGSSIDVFEHAPGRRPVILYCGGTEWDRVNCGFAQMSYLMTMGDPALWDYPGYGDSPGAPSIEGMRELAPHVAKWADELAGERPLVLWGHSLGGAVCAEVATHSDAADLLILEASFDRGEEAVRGVARNVIPVPVHVRVDDAVATIDTGATAAALAISVMVLVAAEDGVIPPDQQRALAAKVGAGERDGRTVVDIPARHNSVMLHPDTRRAVRAEFKRLDWLAEAGS